MGIRSQFQQTLRRATIPQAGFALVFLTALVVAWQLHSANGQVDVQAAEKALAALELHTLKGERLRLQDMQGKPLLLSFWSTSCAICIEEMPEMNRLYHALDAAGARLLSVTMPYDPPNHVLEAAQALDIGFPVAIDLDGSVSTAFSAPGTPFKVLLSKNGEIARTFTGPLDYASTLESVTSLLSKP